MNYGELENREYVVDILMSLMWLSCNVSPAVFSSFSFGIEGCFLFFSYDFSIFIFHSATAFLSFEV